MVRMGQHDELENRYMPRFETLLSESGVVVQYRRDRVGIDTGLHLFAREENPSKQGGNPQYWHALAGRVWFQLKGIHASTMSADRFHAAEHVTVKVGVEHLKFWYAAPEPVYLVVYVESVDAFVGVDILELVERTWGPTFYRSMRHRSGEVTVRVPTGSVMNSKRIASLVNHRSMRIDGPAFRGRPLGHRMDPLRSVLAHPTKERWAEMVARILQVHDFREASRRQIGELTVLRGTIAQTLLWQSPAFAEYGYQYWGEARDEPTLEQVFGEVCIILDGARDRKDFSAEESAAVSELLNSANMSEEAVILFFRGLDRSVTGGMWRSTARGQTADRRGGKWHQLGLEALSFLVLTATVVYLEFAPDLDWDHVNYVG